MDTDYTNTDKSYVYKRTFTVPSSMEGKNILLHFGAVDWHTAVFVNGQAVGEHIGGFDPFYFDITPFLNPSGDQELQVQVYDPTDGGQPKGKQVSRPGGIWYTPSSGIWQTVWLEPVSSIHIKDFLIVPDVDNSLVKITVNVPNATITTQVEITVLDEEDVVITQTADVGTEISIPVADAKLWSPESPFLYNLKFTLKDGVNVVDNIDSYFGMRKISLGKLRGKPYMFLNNKPYFHYGPLDQGFWPDGLLTPPSYEALRYDLEKTKELGFNMTRKHIKVEPARWYYYCDSIGLLVWQDMVSSDQANLGPDGWDWMKENFYRESENVMKSLINYPSIVVWVPYNEGWGQFQQTSEHTRKGVELTRRLDPTRLINPASGWTNFELGDIIDMHYYTTPRLLPNPFNHRASVCGETGGYSLDIEGHMWSIGDNIYNTLNSAEELTGRLEELNNIAFNMTSDGIAGLVYTQITDVETELNGFYTYDRKKFKLNPSQAARFKAGVDKLKTKALVPWSLKIAPYSPNNVWKYKEYDVNPPTSTDWTRKDFDDSSWKEGAASFGTIAPVGTRWETGAITMRKIHKFEGLTEEELKNLKLHVFYDEDVRIWINGVLALSRTGFLTGYAPFTISENARRTIVPGEDNIIAVSCKQTEGGQYIDVGFVLDTDLTTEYEPEAPKTFIPVSTAEELSAIRNNLSGFYELKNDIDLSAYANWEPIGTVEAPFTGYLKGNGYAVKNLKIDRLSRESLKGLIGAANGAYITDLEILDASIKGANDVGALIGKSFGVTVERVVITRPHVEGTNYVGGISGLTEGIVASRFKDCYVVDGTIITRTSQVGGLLGMAQFTQIENSYFTGTIQSRNVTDNAHAGGIIGLNGLVWWIVNTGDASVILKGVASLATSISGGVCNQFVPNGPELLLNENSYTSSSMVLSSNHSSILPLATAEQKKTIAEFKMQALYESMGWDFENVWVMSEDGFPVFKNRPQPTGINNPTQDAKQLDAYSSNGNIIVNVEEATALWIYDLAGKLQERMDIDAETSIPLPIGVYIIKAVSGNNITTTKVLNK